MENYIKAKKIVSKRFPEENPYYIFFIMGLYGILSKYPSYEEEIDAIFQRIDIFIEKKTVSEILRDHNLGYEEEFQEDENDPTFTFGLSSRGDSFYFDDDGKIYSDSTKPFLICSSKYLNPTYLLNTFIHEFNHLLKSYYNGAAIMEKDDSNSYFIRSGFNITTSRYDKNNHSITDLCLYDTIDEVINVLQTTEMMEDIYALKDIILDSRIQSFFQLLSKDYIGDDLGYNTCCDEVRELWKNDTFKSIMETHLMDGNVFEAIRKYDAIMGEEHFDKLADALEKLDDMENMGIEGEELKRKQDAVRSIVEMFQKKTQKIYKK